MGGTAMLMMAPGESASPSSIGRRDGGTPDGKQLAHRGYLQILDSLALGVLIVDAARRVIFANHRAERVLRRGDVLTVSHGRLRAADPQGRAELERLIEAVVASEAGTEGVLALQRPSGEPVFLLVRPLGEDAEETLLLISDSEISPEPRTDIGRLYGLTPAEGRLLDSLLRGRSLAEHARAEGTSVNTVKSQLRQIFAKTGYCRQAQLIGGLLKNPLVHLLHREDQPRG
jgi:DNA-binding CsgD family transcriptional regulator